MDGRSANHSQSNGFHTQSQSQGLYTQGGSQSQGARGGYSQQSQGWGGGYEPQQTYGGGGGYGDTASQESYGFTPSASTQFNTQEPSQPGGARCVSLHRPHRAETILQHIVHPPGS
jgi:hypothetical protein